MTTPPLRLSHSSIAAFLRCPRLWALQQMGYRPVGERGRPLEMGDVIHRALEEWWSGQGSPEERLQFAQLVFTANSANLGFEDRVLGPQLLRGYAAMYGSDELRYQTTPLSESKVETPVLDLDGKPDPRMVLVAKLDVVGYAPNGDTVVIEHKSTASDIRGAGFWDRFNTSLQIPLYWISAHDLGRTPQRAVIDVIRAPIFKRRMATPIENREYYKRATGDAKVGDPKPSTRLADESREDFSARVMESILADPAGYYERRDYPVTDQMLIAARADLWTTGALMLDAIGRAYATPRNSDGCDKFGGRCGFYSACYGGESLDNTQLFSLRSK